VLNKTLVHKAMNEGEWDDTARQVWNDADFMHTPSHTLAAAQRFHLIAVNLWCFTNNNDLILS